MCISIALTRLNSDSARTGGTITQPAPAYINVLTSFCKKLIRRVFKDLDRTSIDNIIESS